MYAWLKRGEHDFKNSNLPSYNRDSLIKWLEEKEWLKQINNAQYFLSLSEHFKGMGVSLIFTPYLNKNVHGAVRWFEGKPLIQISDKDKCLATAWYTLFHEIGHVLYHENQDEVEGILLLSKSSINKKEREANEVAFNYLFNGDGLRRYVFKYRGQFINPSFIQETARQFHVPNIFVAYWMKKAVIKSKTIQENLMPLSFE